MKNKHFVYVALAAAALATSCASEDIAEPQKQGQNQGETRTVTLTASVNEGQTRVGMSRNEDGNTASFYWHKDDAISVLTVNGTSYGNAEFTTTAENGATTATFTGEVTGTVGGYAVYPYSESHTFTSATALTYNLPAAYDNYKPEAKIFGTTDAYPANSTNMPMLGTIASGSITFKHLGGLAVIRIDNMPATEGTLTVTANEQLSGDFAVSDLSASEAQIATTTASGDNGKVVFDFSGATEGSAGVFYLPLATGDYTNLTITIAYGTDNATTQTIPYGSLTVARKGVTAISLSTDSKGNLRHIVDNGNGSYTINGHEFIDLGLSVLWAETNVGADTKTGYGGYFAWGETVARTSDFTQAGHLYTETPETLDAAHDAATANWGAGVRMPTKTEFEELINTSNCTNTYTAENSVNGLKITSKNSPYNSIFLPAAGNYFTSLISYPNEDGYYWSSTTSNNKSGSFYYSTNSTGYSYGTNDAPNNYFGYSVRPVAEKPTTTE